MTLQGCGLMVRAGGRDVLAGVDVSVRRGEVVLLAGRNGAGKSTLLRVLLGTKRPDAGAVSLDGVDLPSVDAPTRARTVAYVPQSADCPFEFSGRELVAMGRHAHRGRHEAERPADRAAVELALDAVDAGAFADRAVTTLSGGELRRIAMARALATAAPLLLLDEPTANLDLEHALRLLALLRRLSAAGHGILVAAHDVNLLAPMASRVLLLHAGRIHADGAPCEVLTAANFDTVFGVCAAASSGYFPRAFALRDEPP